MDLREDCRAYSSWLSHFRRACFYSGITPEGNRMQRSIASCFVALAISLATIPIATAELRIGLAAPLTGPRAWAGEETRAGVEAAVISITVAEY